LLLGANNQLQYPILPKGVPNFYPNRTGNIPYPNTPSTTSGYTPQLINHPVYGIVAKESVSFLDAMQRVGIKDLKVEE
jgi:hypothetical protein